jgi:hypothetical protein
MQLSLDVTPSPSSSTTFGLVYTPSFTFAASLPGGPSPSRLWSRVVVCARQVDATLTRCDTVTKFIDHLRSRVYTKFYFRYFTPGGPSPSRLWSRVVVCARQVDATLTRCDTVTKFIDHLRSRVNTKFYFRYFTPGGSITLKTLVKGGRECTSSRCNCHSM